MLPMREETRLRWRILFLGGWSFEIKETVARQWGHPCLTIVERGQGLRREVRLVGYEVGWIDAKLHMALRNQGCHVSVGRLERKRHSVAIWTCAEENGGSSFQVVVTSEGKRSQVFLSQSEFGDGWEGVALVMEGFAKGDGWVTKIDEAKRKTTVRRVVMSSVGFGESVERGAKMVQGVAEEGGLACWRGASRKSRRRSKGVGFSAMTEWVRRWWKMVRKVEIRLIESRLLVCFTITLRGRGGDLGAVGNRWGDL
ncbi:hypothetical protein LOK49_LG13G02381 [Camellia lanceoleosa]|uniref:Uncharacterized protein n=1 Tax=Camellia lanceoleosa TaxID=1840588 RepID=A0ACC0FJG9_9ERIC|nr:hypothetical protein LOK49_LG13G02381 [Camellia lanceoleosa]